MAKEKFTDCRQMEICGVLDNENGDYVIFVNEEPYKIEELFEQMCGFPVSIKCEMDMQFVKA